MQVSSLPSTPAVTSSAAPAANKNMVDYNSFLQLLVTQMKNQDPTNPTDSTQFLSQLASFSGVEQSVQTNSKLDTLLTGSALSQAEGMVGKQLTSADGHVSGIVQSVTLSGGKLTALLTSGSTVQVTDGVTVA